MFKVWVRSLLIGLPGGSKFQTSIVDHTSVTSPAQVLCVLVSVCPKPVCSHSSCQEEKKIILHRLRY